MEVNLPTKEFKLLRAYFQMNLDKECFMGSDNSVKVIASIYGKKVQKILMIIAVVLLRVTIICTGSAGSNKGPIIFLCAAKDKSGIPKNLCGD